MFPRAHNVRRPARATIALAVAAAMLALASPGAAQKFKTGLTRPAPPPLQTVGTIADVERLDADARNAQRLRTRRTTNAGGVHYEFDYTRDEHAKDVEAALDRAIDDAWQQVARSHAFAQLVDEVLLLATLDLHVEVRRALPLTFSTQVPGLTDDAGCAGDLVAERLIYAYGSAVANPLSGPTDARVTALARLARLVACLGSTQVSALDKALTDGFATVSGHMEAHGLAAAVPTFVRALAPFQLVVFDATKHRGARSRSWQWFNAYTPMLMQEISLHGWSTGELLLWGRRSGLMIGFPPCAPGRQRPDCVDVLGFLESLNDPRALGYGDCALAAMISRGPQQLGNDDRYACPVRDCQPPTTNAPCTPSGFGTSSCGGRGQPGAGNGPFQNGAAQLGGGAQLGHTAGIRSRWPNLSNQQVGQMKSLCRGGTHDLLGVDFSLQDCLEQKQNENPFEQHLACIGDAVGGGAPDVAGELRGVPSGSKCRFTNGGGSNTPKPQNTPTPAKTPSPGSSPGASPAPAASPKPAASPAPAASPKPYKLTVTVRKKDGSKSVAVLEDDGKGKRTIFVKKGKGSDIAFPLLRSLVHGDAGEQEGLFRWAVEKLANKDLLLLVDSPKDCIDPASCDDSCTGLGEQISKARACNEDLLDALATATGRPNRKKISRRLDIVSYPRPDESPPPEDDACLGGEGHGRPRADCGLVLCSNGVSARRTDDGCVCDDTFEAIGLADLCAGVRCTDGSLPDADCQCPPPEGYTPGGDGDPSPGPRPDFFRQERDDDFVPPRFETREIEEPRLG